MAGYTSKDYSIAQLDRVLDLWANGNSFGNAMKQAGVKNHTAAEIHAKRFAWFMAELPQPGVGEWAFSEAKVAFLHAEGWGVGNIMVALDATEGVVRKGFAKATGNDRRGQRVAKGGRMLNDNPELYEAELKSTGTEIPVGELGRANVHASRQLWQKQLMTKTMDELIAECKEAGITVPKRPTPGQLISKLVKASNA